MGIDRSALRAIIPDEARLQFDGIDPKYFSDNFGRKSGQAEALVFPVSTEEVSALMRYAHTNRIHVTPRGAGTNLVGSTVPVKGGIILDLSKMNRILELDRDTFTATVEPGVVLRDFQAYVEKEGLFYPPDPGEKSATIGGNISTNAGGMRAVKYGVTRDYVRGLEVVLADGTVTAVGGKQVKDSSGLSLKNLLIGSEGTLAVITKCMLKLIPKPESTVSVLVPYRDLKTGIASVLTILQANANPTAVEFMVRKVVQFGEEYTGIQYPCPQAGSYILLTFDGRAEEVQASLEKVRKLTLEQGALDYIVLSDSQLSADIWSVRGALVSAADAVSEEEPLDLVVPIDRTASFMEFINGLEAASGMRIISFGHAGDGNIHLCLMRDGLDDQTWRALLRENEEKAYTKAYEYGGVASGEHGIGLSKRSYFLEKTPRANLRLMNSIKDAFDPLHILNDQISYIAPEKTAVE